jgi:hypothetical protein
MPTLLTGDQYLEAIWEWEEGQAEEEKQKEARVKARKIQSAEMVLWEEEDQKRRERNEEKTHTWKAAIKDWEVQRAEAKLKKLKLKDWDIENPKPKAKNPQFAHEPAAPKPKIRKTGAQETEEHDEGEEVVIDEEEISTEGED